MLHGLMEETEFSISSVLEEYNVNVILWNMWLYIHFIVVDGGGARVVVVVSVCVSVCVIQ